MSSGSSPLARGTRRSQRLHRLSDRFIPAGAGNTATPGASRCKPPVHPRWRGEHPAALSRLPNVCGSSPLARGTLVPQHDRVTRQRFIPAGAGNTRQIQIGDDGRAVHPRWRGEHHHAPVLDQEFAGSSPLARGTPQRPGRRHPQPRFIPAGAGNTLDVHRGHRDRTVHPRWRGEHAYMICAIRAIVGSSPLARGTLAGADGVAGGARFIPAGAGNTRLAGRTGGRGPVHPRWRGEHKASVYLQSGLNGSSPLARGTRPSFFRVHTLGRFIPAGAGNTRPSGF